MIINFHLFSKYPNLLSCVLSLISNSGELQCNLKFGNTKTAFKNGEDQNCNGENMVLRMSSTEIMNKFLSKDNVFEARLSYLNVDVSFINREP